MRRQQPSLQAQTNKAEADRGLLCAAYTDFEWDTWADVGDILEEKALLAAQYGLRVYHSGQGLSSMQRL